MITAGEWQYVAELGEVHAVQDNGAQAVQVALLGDADNDEDGHVLAASKALLAACEHALERLDPHGADEDRTDEDRAACVELTAAIAKARGQQ